jgi:hypothetical protein
MTKLYPELFTATDSSYEGAREHSEKLDLHLGFEIAKIEQQLLECAQSLDPGGSHKSWGQSLHAGNQTWVGLSHQTLQTPYSELKQMCELLNPVPGSRLVDLGAGYGRIGLVLAALYPEVVFLGYEYVLERVAEGRRILEAFRCTGRLEKQDLTAEDFQLPEAEYYFLYDYGTVAHIRKTLGHLEMMAEKKNFKVIARGKGTRSLIQYEYPWLSDIYPPLHQEQYSIFSMSQNV